jgi:hypothetical protein
MAKAKDGELCPICQTPIRLGDTKPLRNNNDILPYLDHFRDKKQEFFICLSLDSGRHTRAKYLLARWLTGRLRLLWLTTILQETPRPVDKI